MVTGLPILTKVSDVCEGYATGKHHREKFDKKTLDIKLPTGSGVHKFVWSYAK